MKQPFLVERRVIRLNTTDVPGRDEVDEWFKHRGFLPVGPLAATEDQQDTVKALLWTYRDIFVDDLRDIPPTDLIHHRVRLKEGTPVHSEKQRRYAGQREY